MWKYLTLCELMFSRWQSSSCWWSGIKITWVIPFFFHSTENDETAGDFLFTQFGWNKLYTVTYLNRNFYAANNLHDRLLKYNVIIDWLSGSAGELAENVGLWYDQTMLPMLACVLCVLLVKSVFSQMSK